MRVALACVLAACVSPTTPLDLGTVDGKSDGIVDQSVSIDSGATQHIAFSTPVGFRVALSSDPGETLAVTLTAPDASTQQASDTRPSLLVDPAIPGDFDLAVTNTGDDTTTVQVNVRPIDGWNGLPDPNADTFPDVSWQPPAVDTWPSTYVIFNNPGCGHDCTPADLSAQQPRSVMIKMLVAAITNVSEGGTVRVSNFNISSSASAKPVVDALVYAMQTKHATVRIVMDDAQNTPDSKTTWLSQNGAEVRFLNGLTYTNSVGPAVGIMHSKIVAVDDQIVFTGSNNFSSTGFVINEENSVVLRAPDNSDRIASFICDVDTMFSIGVPAGQPQLSDDARREQILALDKCNGAEVWFPPTGVIANGSSITYNQVAHGISRAEHSLSFAPDMMAHPGLVNAIISRAKRQKAHGAPISVRLVLDSSPEALGNPAFGDCLEVAAQKYDLDVQVRYWRGNPDIFQLMHHKFMLVDAGDPDNATLFNGSANYSAKALKESFENVTRYRVADQRAIVEAFAKRFDKMFAIADDKATLAGKGIVVPACPLDPNSL
jgi:HKD family nuclease